MQKEETQVREAFYNKLDNKVYLNAAKEEFVPDFLKYLLESMDVPKDVEVVFMRGYNGQTD